MPSPRPDEIPALVEGLLRGQSRALARLITAVEDDPEGALEVVARLPPRPAGHVLGVTGPPGAGKSTLVDRVVAAERAKGHRVAVLLVDPSSPFTGGAVLADRIRMQHHTADPGVFIRSLGSRGHGGGLTAGTAEVVALALAAGYPRVVLETVGVGQTELEVMELADTVAVIAVPGAGDSIQAMKAGLMEIGHLFVVNKADRPGADRLVAELREMIAEGSPPARIVAGGWRVPVIAVSALQGTGLAELDAAVDAHRSLRLAHPRPPVAPRRQVERLVIRAVARRVAASLRASLGPGGAREALGAGLDSGAVPPAEAARVLLADADLLAAWARAGRGEAREGP
ncbi:methylmalonyl Co-A mutase-associated GTPase MeaB [Myxococcota bacterium]|nr:methylmalonyl Co-A mutase-associated GTPase MeaB [Myxococcota bacterium]